MNNIFFLIMRRMRLPLLSLILVLSVSALGMTLIPGQDVDGNQVQVSFFRAFYFVSYMTTTIGFSELPPVFTDAQRLWVLFCIYANVIVWLYAIGSMFNLFQDKAFQRALHEWRFTKQIRRLRRTFYLICGYGDTAEALVEDLMNRGHQVVVVEPDQERINTLRLGGLPGFVPALSGDSTKPDNLLKAGLRNPLCAGVAALTNKSEINLKVAVTSKLLHPNIKVYCRADRKDVEANMTVFRTDFIIDPYDLFGLQLAIALQAPALLLLYTWLTEEEEEQSQLSEPVYPPQHGHWILCGYGRFGKVLCRRLVEDGIDVTVVEATPDITGRPVEHDKVNLVEGWGTESKTLQDARLNEAVALVAGTDNDIVNLAIIMAARQENSRLFVVARQNQLENAALFEAIGADILMHPSQIIATQVRTLLATPMLYEFMSLSLHQDNTWACQLISRISALVDDEVPRVWELGLSAEGAYAVHWYLQRSGLVTLGDLLRDRHQPDRDLAAICLLLTRLGERVLLPEQKTRLQPGDRLLFCSARGVRDQMDWTLQNLHVLSHILNIQPSLGGDRFSLSRFGQRFWPARGRHP
jgi:Trk K+ transport system NAD-binding subunit